MAIHTSEETEAKIAWVNSVIADVEHHCDILPVDGLFDPRLERLLGSYKAQKIFDPIQLAKDQALIIVSEDLRLRQFAAQQQVIGGAWLQVLFHVMAADNLIAQRDYLVGVGMLGAMRHEHLWLDAKTLIGILSLDDSRALALYEAAIRFMGGAKADISSHIGVTIDFMLAIWNTPLPDWQRSRAVGRLLEQLTRSRPNDWKAMLHILDAELSKWAARGSLDAGRGRDYLTSWIAGHFYDLREIRSAERILAQGRANRPLKVIKQKKAANRKSDN